jgi:hypothetical protein
MIKELKKKWEEMKEKRLEKIRKKIKEKYGYDYVGKFSKGLAPVQKRGKWFHVRSNGRPAYKEKYDDVGLFSEGLAVVRKDKKFFHIRPDGGPAYRERFDEAKYFLGGIAPTKKDGKWFFIHPDGKPESEEKFDNVDWFAGMATVEKDGKKFSRLLDGRLVPAKPFYERVLEKVEEEDKKFKADLLKKQPWEEEADQILEQFKTKKSR